MSARDWMAGGFLMVVAAVLRFHELGSQLWLDEMSALNSIGRPASEIATRWPGASSHVLYELLARLGLVTLGEGPVGIRLPAALFGIAGVGAFYVLARQVAEPRRALAVGGLFALSYHHVFFSQNARGYTTLIFFFVVATALLLEFRRRGRVGGRGGAAYGLVVALGAYANLFGIFVPAAHALVVIGFGLRARRAGEAAPVPPGPFLGAATAGAAATALLYLPFVGGLLAYVRMNVSSPGEGPRLGWGLVAEVVEGLSAATYGPVGLLVAMFVGLVGLVVLWRRTPFGAAILLAPLALQVVAMVASGIGIHPRYLSTALPVVVLIGGLGIAAVVEGAVPRLTVSPVLRERSAAAILFVIVAASGLPLLRYYDTPKQDYLGAMQVVDSLAADGDTRVGVHLAGHVLSGFYNADFEPAEDLRELEELERGASRVWLVTTLERLLRVEDPRLYQHIKERYRLVRVLPGTVGDGEMRIYERSH